MHKTREFLQRVLDEQGYLVLMRFDGVPATIGEVLPAMGTCNDGCMKDDIEGPFAVIAQATAADFIAQCARFTPDEPLPDQFSLDLASFCKVAAE